MLVHASVLQYRPLQHLLIFDYSADGWYTFEREINLFGPEKSLYDPVEEMNLQVF